MNKEFKEILNYMKQYVENKYEHDSEPMLNYKDLQIVLSYIEQLKKENDRLKKDYAIVINDNCDYITLEKKIEQLENNRDKAIEYIEKDLQISILPNNQIINGTEVVKRINKIEDILKGDSDE